MRRPRQFVRRVSLALLTLVAALLSAVGVRAHPWTTECNINFDNNFALANIYEQARATFGVSTGISASGQLQVCNPATHLACWFYRQRCGVPGYVNVEPVGYPHFHLSFEDPTLTDPATSCFVNGGFGRKVGGVCTAPDWSREPRVLNPHDQTQWTKVWLADRVSAAPRVFDVASLRIGGTQPVQFWFQKTDGTWWFWGSLGPGLWDLSAYAFDVMQVWIRGAGGAVSTPTIQGIVIRA